MAHPNSKPLSREGLLKISDLVRETGVPIATIKFYLRERLLPTPTLKTGRNMAYYDRTFVDRIRFIKDLQQKRFLPLDVIKAIIDRNDAVISPHEIDTLIGLEGTFYEAIHSVPEKRSLTRAQILERYDGTEEDLAFLVDLKIVTPIDRSGTQCFEDDDVLIFETLSAMTNAGITRELFSHKTALPTYLEKVDDLVREELKIFTQSVTGTVQAHEVPDLAMSAVKLAEQLIVLLRRKRLLAAIQEMREQQESGAPMKAAG